MYGLLCVAEADNQASSYKHCEHDPLALRPVYDKARAQTGQFTVSSMWANFSMKNKDAASSMHVKSVSRTLALTFFLIMLTYNFVVWVADLNSFILNFALFVLPMLIASFSLVMRNLKLAPLIILSALLAFVAVTSMSMITFLHGIWSGYDNVTILPRDEQELARDLQGIYFIASGFSAGALLPLAAGILRAGIGSIDQQRLVRFVAFIVNVVGPLLILAVKIAREWLRQ